VAEPSARRAALIALRAWQDHNDRADVIIANILGEAKLPRADRAFALELFYGVLRNLTVVDFWIGCLRTDKVEPYLRDILRLGIYQLFFLGTPDHAAVNESVELALPKARGLVNGVLRNAIRDRDELRSRARRQALSVRSSHPGFLVTRWQRNFGLEPTAALCHWNNQPPPIYARINRLKIDSEQFAQRYPEEAEPWAGQNDFFICAEVPTTALKRGHCYIQDPSTIIAGSLLDPQPEEKILDACAAPGGKTAHLAQLMQNRGLILACDRDEKRIQTAKENIERLGLTMARACQHNWLQRQTPKEIQEVGLFDRILVDVPCTNTGVMRRRVDVRWRLQPESVARMRQQQLEILRRVAKLLKPGGILVYSTCSLEPEENEEAVQEFLLEFPKWQLVEQRFSRPFVDKLDGAFAAKLTSPVAD
jgi:16S rRNA (cytosine967-C5)-methyltransferase